MTSETTSIGTPAENLARRFWYLRTFESIGLPTWDELTDDERAKKIENAQTFIDEWIL